MRNLTLIALLLAVFCIFTSCEKSDSFVNTTNEDAVNTAQIDGLIQSSDDFSRVITTTENPLSKLSSKTLKLFKESLRFNEKGELATARVAEVKAELSNDDFVNIWTLFNVDKYEIKAAIIELNNKAEDYPGFECVGPNYC